MESVSEKYFRSQSNYRREEKQFFLNFEQTNAMNQ